MAQPFSAANTSTANFPLTSVAVVITGTAPREPASRRASLLAPPTWPERRGMTNRPPSSTATTAGSRNLSRTQGATARTAMPQAPTKIRASLSPNRSPLQAESSPANTSSPSSPRQNLSRAKFRHRIPSLSRIRRILRLTSLPLSVKLITAALKVSPPSG